MSKCNLDEKGRIVVDLSEPKHYFFDTKTRTIIYSCYFDIYSYCYSPFDVSTGVFTVLYPKEEIDKRFIKLQETKALKLLYGK